MDAEMIDWENIESEFVEDEEYENIDAPKWVDLSIPEEVVDDDEAWFCKSGCKHPKTAEDFLKSKSFKIKLLRSMTVSEFRPFRDKSRRGGFNLKRTEKSSASAKQEFSKSKRLSTNELHSSQSFQTDAENQNPNHSSQHHPSCRTNTRKEAGTRSTEKKQISGSMENQSSSDQKLPPKDTFSARNLLKGREIMSQLTDFCTTLKKMANKRTKKEAGEKDLSVILPAEMKTTTGERWRRPLQAK